MIKKSVKCLFVVLLFYTGFFQYVFFQIPNFITFIGILIVFLVITDIWVKKKNLCNYLNLEIVIWFLFALVSLFSGYVVAQNKLAVINGIFQFIQFVLLIFSMNYISYEEKSIEFLINVFLIYAFISSAKTVFYGVPYQGIIRAASNATRVTLATNFNPNALGVVAVIGITSGLFYLYRYNRKKYILTIFIIIIMCYAIILCQSRKALLALVIVICLWVLFCYKELIKEKNIRVKVINVLFFLVVFVIFTGVLYKVILESGIYQRLITLFAGGEYARLDMYSEGKEFFSNNPIWGVGYNNFRYLSIYGTYSHSTYAEIFSCTGIVGGTLYLSVYIIMLVKSWCIILQNKKQRRYEAKVIIIMQIVLIFLGIGIINFYEFTSMIVYGIIISFNNLYFINKK